MSYSSQAQRRYEHDEFHREKSPGCFAGLFTAVGIVVLFVTVQAAISWPIQNLQCEVYGLKAGVQVDHPTFSGFKSLWREMNEPPCTVISADGQRVPKHEHEKR